MRVLGIETTSARGSVALVEAGTLVAVAVQQRENAHGETIQPLIEELLARAGWSLASLDRVAVGTGPGSFTGSRVGIALAQGIAEGLERPLIGVCSLAAMALATPADVAGTRCPVLDARRGESFFALYAPDGRELTPPTLAESPEALLQKATAHGPVVFVGSGCPALPAPYSVFRHEETDLPHARWTALAALTAAPEDRVTPCYVRHTVAIVPDLPQNPLASR